jgi:hypothetical protein
VVVWQVDAAVATEEWWLRVTDPAVWGTAVGAVPMNGTPWPVPGMIEAEYFDDGGTNVGYFDKTNNWSVVAWFNEFRFLEHVDIRRSASASAGTMVTSAESGEWARYTLTVAKADIYTLEVRVASDGAGGTFHVEFNGVDKTGSINIPNTEGWESWAIVTKTGISLNAGPQVMRLVMDNNGPAGLVGNFDYLRLTAASAVPLVTVAATDPNAAEAGTKPGIFTLTRSGDPTVALTVTYSMGGSATNGIDYAALSGTLTFGVGQGSATVVVNPVDDNLVEGSESVVLTIIAPLASPITYTVGAQASATVTLADDDARQQRR